MAVDEVHCLTEWGTSRNNKNRSVFCVWYSRDSPIFTSPVWNFWPRIADVSLRVSHEVAGANEKRLYSQAKTSRNKCKIKIDSKNSNISNTI